MIQEALTGALNTVLLGTIKHNQDEAAKESDKRYKAEQAEKEQLKKEAADKEAEDKRKSEENRLRIRDWKENAIYAKAAAGQYNSPEDVTMDVMEANKDVADIPGAMDAIQNYAFQGQPLDETYEFIEQQGKDIYNISRTQQLAEKTRLQKIKEQQESERIRNMILNVGKE